MGSTSVPGPSAKKPERVVDVEPDEIELGTSDATQGTDLKTQGKRSLTRPSGGSTPVAGLNI